jgi:hypothetical protein
LAPKAKCQIWIYFAAQCWSLWTVRNKFTIEGKFPRQPADCVFKTILSLQLWHQLQNVKDWVLLDELISLARTFFASTYSPPSPPAYDLTLAGCRRDETTYAMGWLKWVPN